MNFPPRSAEAIAAITHMTTAKLEYEHERALNDGPMRLGEEGAACDGCRLCRAGGGRGPPGRAGSSSGLYAQEGGEDVAERRAWESWVAAASRDAVGRQAVEHRRGHLVVQPDDEQGEEEPHRERAGLSAKVTRMPEAAPRWRAGTEFMIEEVFGEANRPPPIPLVNITNANGQ